MHKFLIILIHDSQNKVKYSTRSLCITSAIHFLHIYIKENHNKRVNGISTKSQLQSKQWKEMSGTSEQKYLVIIKHYKVELNNWVVDC